MVEGGSTITQQLVKNLYVGDAETLRRKIDEASLAWQLEDRLSKDRILTKYLNTVYLGEGAYGVQSAAQTYFSTDADDLTPRAVGPAGGPDRRAEPLRPVRAPRERLRPAQRRAASRCVDSA